LFAFVESGKMSPREEFEQQTLPINAAIVFFEDKQLLDIQSRLEFERDKQEVSQLTVEQLAQYIEIVRTGIERTPEVETETVPVDVPEQIAAPVEQPAVPSVEPLPELVSNVQPAEEIKALNEVPPAAAKSSMLVFGGEDDDQYLASSPGLKQKEIRDLFNKEEHELIVRKIFNKDEPAFLGAMMEISLQKSWEDVAHYLDALYIVNDVDPFGNESVLFTDRLFAHYHSSKPE